MGDQIPGCGFRRGDRLKPLPDTKPAFEIKDSEVVVLAQNPSEPDHYVVIGERVDNPGDPFVIFEINGRGWDRA